MPIVVNES